VPLGGVIISDEIAATFDERVFPGGLTYSGHPLACASAWRDHAMEDEGIVEHGKLCSATDRDRPGPARSGRQARRSSARSAGSVSSGPRVWSADRETREPLAPYGGTSEAMGALTKACVSRGLLPFTNFNRMHVVPPCVITEDEAAEGLAILDEAFSEVDAYYTG
jgi:taurine--2-oxoglutarate transaminase